MPNLRAPLEEATLPFATQVIQGAATAVDIRKRKKIVINLLYRTGNIKPMNITMKSQKYITELTLLVTVLHESA